MARLGATGTAGVAWDRYEHPELYVMLAGARPERIGYRAGKWAKLSDNLADLNDEVHALLEEIAGVWSGRAASAAAEHTAALQRWADETVATARTISARLGTYADAVAAAKKAMPEPISAPIARPIDNDTEPRSILVAESDFYSTSKLAQAYHPTMDEQRRRTEQARAVMRALEVESRSIKQDTPHVRSEPRLEGPLSAVPYGSAELGGGGIAPPLGVARGRAKDIIDARNGHTIAQFAPHIASTAPPTTSGWGPVMGGWGSNHLVDGGNDWPRCRRSSATTSTGCSRSRCSGYTIATDDPGRRRRW